VSTTDPSQWIKASASDGGGNCVEMRRTDMTIEVRDTKVRGEGPSLALSPIQFAAWLDGAKSGELDTFI
jgi:hypothetical protein